MRKTVTQTLGSAHGSMKMPGSNWAKDVAKGILMIGDSYCAMRTFITIFHPNIQVVQIYDNAALIVSLPLDVHV